jgi:alkylation response protein AidB-like acyl-CoA dehydrogenase
VDGEVEKELWASLAGLGWLGTLIPVAFGGAGCGLAELVILQEEFGRSLLPAPFFSSGVLAAGVLAYSAPAASSAELMSGVADGIERAGVVTDGIFAARSSKGRVTVSGVAERVIDGLDATTLIVPANLGGELRVFSVAASTSGVARVPLESLDMTRRQTRLELRDARATLLADDVIGFRRAIAESTIALAAEMIGGARWCLDTAVDYSKVRYQFDRPIGSFQAVKHECARRHVELQLAAAVVDHSVEGAPTGSNPRLFAAMAKLAATSAFVSGAWTAIHVLGGIGMTWDHDAHLYFRRAHGSSVLLGDVAEHRATLAHAVIDRAAA